MYRNWCASHNFFVTCTRFRAQKAERDFEIADESEGEMLEWLKRHAWKACIRQKRIGGSNPPLSAEVSADLSDSREG